MASKKPAAKGAAGALPTAYMNTDSGPAAGPSGKPTEPALKRAAAVGATAASMPHNANKAAEYGEQAARCPYTGAQTTPPDPSVGASALSESESPPKTRPPPRTPPPPPSPAPPPRLGPARCPDACHGCARTAAVSR